MAIVTARSLFCEALDRQVRDSGGRLAVRSESEKTDVTFGGLAGRIGAWTSILRKRGLQPGQAAALAVGNTLAFIELFFALRSLGVCVLPMEEALAGAPGASVASRMGASWVLQRREGEPLSAAPDPAVRLQSVLPGAAIPEGTEILKLTSGSTLSPRGACFSEAALVEGVRHILEGMSLTSGDRVLLAIPLSHSYGFDNGVLSLAAGGTPLVLQPDVLPGALLGSMKDHGATMFPAVPALIRALSQVAWPKGLALRRVISASAPLSPEVAEAFYAASGLRVHQFLGSTETGGISFETRPEEAAAAGAVGFPLPGVRIDLDAAGIVRIHSKANRFAMLPAGRVTPEVETGDRGEWTPEGRLRLLGRATLTANLGGIKIDLGSLEAFLRGLPGVDEAAALAVEGSARGQRILAFVEGRGCGAEALLELCRLRLSAREVPSEIRVLERLPRTERGKPDRAALAALR